MAHRTPTNVVASLLAFGETTVDYSIDWNITYAPNLHPGPYTVTVSYSKNGAAYVTLIIIPTSDAPATSTDHAGADIGATYLYRVVWYCDGCDGGVSLPGYSNTIKTYSDTETETVTLTDEVTVSEFTAGSYVTDTITLTESIAITMYDTVTDTLTLTDYVRDATTLKTNYAYYLGDENGDIYHYAADYGGFNGGAMESYIKLKKTDFSDAYAQAANHFNTAYRAKLTYVDKGESFVTFYWSTDGGTTWYSRGKTIGTTAAPGTTKVAYFDFIATGEFFNFKLGSSSTTGDFQWAGLEIEFEVGGETFPV